MATTVTGSWERETEALETASTPIPTASPVVQVACGYNHTFLRFEDGRIAACGYNYYKQLGLPCGEAHAFVPVPTPSPVAQVACGDSHTFLLFEGGTIAACGSNYSGQLGLNDNNCRNRGFVFVPTASPVIQVVCGSYYTFLRFEDGTVAACGDNAYGQLGVGNGNRYYHFVPVLTDLPVAQVACGVVHTFLRFEDGSMAGLWIQPVRTARAARHHRSQSVYPGSNARGRSPGRV